MTHVKRRAGISLLEVLISMFILLTGLAGIAALLPAGRSEIMAGVKLDYAMMIGRNALREFRTRDYVNPRRWASVDSSGNGSFPTWDATNTNGNPFVLPNVGGSNRSDLAVMLDPLGLSNPGGSLGNTFPSGATLGGISLVRVGLDQLNASTFPLADELFRCADDLNLAPNTIEKKSPPIQKISAAGQRVSTGSYSWFATVVPDATALALTSRVTVSVAVLSKRDFGSLAMSEDAPKIVAMPGNGINTGEVVVFNSRKALRPGQWVMIGGFDNSSGKQLNQFRWCKVVAASERIIAANYTGTTLASGIDSSKMVQGVTLAGADWSLFPAAGTSAMVSSPVPWPSLFIVDNVIAVYESTIEQR